MGTKAEEGIKHRNGMLPPIIGRLGSSGETTSHYQFCESRSSTTVRVSGSSGDGGCYSESLSEDVKIKTEHGMEAL